MRSRLEKIFYYPCSLALVFDPFEIALLSFNYYYYASPSDPECEKIVLLRSVFGFLQGFCTLLNHENI